MRAAMAERDAAIAAAVASGARIVFNCGFDCIPSDLTVFEMNKFAKEKGFELKEVQLYEVRNLQVGRSV